jgi:hypothetical protein
MKDLLKTIIPFLLVAVLLASCNGFLLTPSPLPSATETSIPTSERIVYYYFVVISENNPPEGSVVIMPNELILAPTQTNITYTSDTPTNLRTSLEAVLNDERNSWISSNLELSKVAFSEGHADIVLQGEYYGVAPVILTAARMQILMTLFANASVQTATVTLNGDTIANIDASREGKPLDYVFTRTEIETFIAEHAYVTP